MRKACLIVGVWIAASAVLAANVWNTKPFTEWTDRDLQKVLTDSPWAGRGSVTHTRPGGGQPPIDWRVTIVWRSGLPIKQGLVREQVGLKGEVPAEVAAILGNEEQFYMISVDGLPGTYGMSAPGGRGQQMMATLAANTQLNRGRGKTPLSPVNIVPVMFGPDGRPMEPMAPGRGGMATGRGGPGGSFGGRGGPQTTAMLIFFFPKNDPLTLEDREVEFASVIGTYNVKRKFNLRNMTVNGQLAL